VSDAPHITYFNMGPWPLYFGFTQSKKAFAKEMKRLSIEGVDFLASDHANATVHSFTSSGCLTCVMTMGKVKDKSPEQVASLIAHEATHVAQELWAQIGERQPGREAEAYLVQMIVQCCLQIACKTGRERSTSP
jgi:hypothetical protein